MGNFIGTVNLVETRLQRRGKDRPEKRDELTTAKRTCGNTESRLLSTKICAGIKATDVKFVAQMILEIQQASFVWIIATRP